MRRPAQGLLAAGGGLRLQPSGAAPLRGRKAVGVKVRRRGPPSLGSSRRRHGSDERWEAVESVQDEATPAVRASRSGGASAVRSAPPASPVPHPPPALRGGLGRLHSPPPVAWEAASARGAWSHWNTDGVYPTQAS